MNTHWIERAICALPGFKLETAEELSYRWVDSRSPRTCFVCMTRAAVCSGPWGLAWLVGQLYYGYWFWRNGDGFHPKGGWVSERRELELWRMTPYGAHWSGRVPGVWELPKGEWPVWVDYERREIVSAEFPRCILQRAFWYVYAWLRWGEPLNPEERRELDGYLDQERRKQERLAAFFKAATECPLDTEWDRFLFMAEKRFEEDL